MKPPSHKVVFPNLFTEGIILTGRATRSGAVSRNSVCFSAQRWHNAFCHPLIFSVNVEKLLQQYMQNIGTRCLRILHKDQIRCTSRNKAGTEIAQKPHPLSAFFNKYFSCRKTMIFQDIFVWKLVPKKAWFSKQKKEGNGQNTFSLPVLYSKKPSNPNI